MKKNVIHNGRTAYVGNFGTYELSEQLSVLLRDFGEKAMHFGDKKQYKRRSEMKAQLEEINKALLVLDKAYWIADIDVKGPLA